jgi:alpha-L-rhamnosidase
MLPEDMRKQAAQRLADNVKSYNNHLTTGFLGTPYLCQVLTRYGYLDLAYTLLLQPTYPSWLYPVKMGATTIWERWDGIKPDSSFQVPSMNSYNHYAYGAIGDWMYRTVAGLDTYQDGPGYKHIRIKPYIGGDFTQVSASLKTYYGDASSSWKLENGILIMDLEIPANTIATVYIPTVDQGSVKESGGSLTASIDFSIVGMEEGYLVLKIGSGSYHFSTDRYKK